MIQTKKFTLDGSVGEMVAVFPKATEIFNKYKIDYCCQGEDSLTIGAGKVKADAQKVLDELNDHYALHGTDMGDSDKTGENLPAIFRLTTSDLLDHVLDTHHLYAKQALQEIDSLLQKILKVHYEAHHDELTRVFKAFGALRTELYAHMIREEELVFPAMYDYDRNPSALLKNRIKTWIDELEQEHQEAGKHLKEMQSASNSFVAPMGACPTYISTYRELRELTEDIMEHIHKENTILFARF